jgi:ISXO2-like transposase domain
VNARQQVHVWLCALNLPIMDIALEVEISRKPIGSYGAAEVNRRVMSLLKRWLMGTHQGAVSQNHLDDYLDEFTFRFNRRTSASRGKLFYRLAQYATQVDPAPYASLITPQHLGCG